MSLGLPHIAPPGKSAVGCGAATLAILLVVAIIVGTAMLMWYYGGLKDMP